MAGRTRTANPVMEPLRVFIGYDPRESIAFHVLSHSILRRASAPVAIIPIVRDHLGKVFTRERGPLESTDFAISRFLVPYLSGYAGVSVFMDCDMLCLADIHELNPERSGVYDKATDRRISASESPAAVWVAKHDYVPKSAIKMDGQQQTAYPRKNWSSLIVFDNARCRALSPDYVNLATGLELHRFHWIRDEAIGALPLEWNWLIGEYPKNHDAKILHYTLGGPWMDGHRDCDHAEEWYAERAHMMEPSPKGVLPPWVQAGRCREDALLARMGLVG